jgi:SPP1 gp7 family putative phage head morphogenesis protein
MAGGGNFTPGRPQNPYFGYSTRARSTDYPISVNTNIQGRAAWGRVSYETLANVYRAYDVARMAVNHKIDQLRSMEPMFLPAHGVKDDVEDEIEAARLVLEFPDRQLPYEAWLGKWLENAIKYDSAPLYRRRDYNGDVIGLEVVDGKTIFPYIDANGRTPQKGAPAFAQVIHGMIGTWFTTDDMICVPFRPQEDSPYGMAPLETLLFTANTDMRMQWHFLQLFTDGSVPAGFMELPPDVSSPEQVAEWQDYWDATVMGDQAKLHQLIAVPYGSKFTGTKPAAFDKSFPEYLMMRACAGHGVLPQNVGLIEDVNRSNGDQQDEIQFRVNTLPWVFYVQGILSRYLQRDIGLRVRVKLNTGRDKKDLVQEAQAHQIYCEIGAESPDEVRVDVLGKKADKDRPTPRSIMVQRVGPIPIFALEGVAGITDPETFGPAASQPVLDQPFVPPVGAIATPGSADDQAVQQTLDQYQQYVRRSLESGGDPKRETPAQKQQRGQKAEQDQAQAAQNAGAQQPQPGQQSAQPIEGETTKAQPKTQPVAKQQLDGAEAGELLAFRAYVAARRRRGEWDRDFGFQHVRAREAQALNAGARAEIAKAAGAPDAYATASPVARKVYDQLLADFPPKSIAWVLGEKWAAKQVPLEQVDWSHADTWTASQEPKKVAKLAGKMRHGKAQRHAILIARPGKPTLMAADGHHHLKAHQLNGDAKAPAYVMEASSVHGPWDELHSAQNPHSPVAKAAGDPKAQGQSADDWPGWKYDLEGAQYWAPRIAAALAGAIGVHELVTAWLATQQQSQQQTGETKQEREHRALVLIALATSWLRSYQAAIVTALTPVLEELYTDGYVIGAASAQAYLATLAATQGGTQAAERVIEADLAHWLPGDTDAATLLLGQWGDGAGLRSLLAADGVTIKSIADTRLEELGKLLGQGVADGLTPEQIAGQIRDLLSNPSRALMIAQTEMSRAVCQAAQDRYRRAGYLATRWVTDGNPCPVCVENQDRGAVAIGQPFPSGDLRPPAHPRCRCVPVPAYVEE